MVSTKRELCEGFPVSMFSDKDNKEKETTTFLTEIQQTWANAVADDIQFIFFTLGCLYIFSEENTFNRYLERTHLVRSQELILAQGSNTSVNAYVAASGPFGPFPSYQDLNEISLWDWIEIAVSQCVADGTCNKCEN